MSLATGGAGQSHDTPRRSGVSGDSSKQQPFAQAEYRNRTPEPASRLASSHQQRRSTLTPSRYIPPSPLPSAIASLASHQQQHHASSSASQLLSTAIPGYAGLRYRVIASDAELKSAMDADCAAVDAALKDLRMAKSDRRRRHEAVKVELLQEERTLESECERLRREGGLIVKTLEKEKEEVTEAQTTVTELENRKRALAAQLNALKADEEEWSAKVRARREFIAQEQAAFDLQAQQDGPELAFLEEAVGLVITGLPNDIVQFTYTLVDPADHKRAFTFELDASKSTYSVKSSKPPLPPASVQSALSTLNETGDLSVYLHRMREAFAQLVRE